MKRSKTNPDRDDSWCKNLVGLIVAKYKLLKFVGAGKIGYVYLAEHCVAPVSLCSGKNRAPAGFRRFDVAGRATPASQPQPAAAMAC